MDHRITILAGPAGSGKTQRLLRQYRAAFSAPSAGPGGLAAQQLWLTPTHRSVRDVVEQLLSDDMLGCLRPQVMTFDQFAEQVIDQAGQPVEPLAGLAKRQLIGRLIREAHGRKELTHFGPIADQPGLVDLVVECIGELKRLEIWPEHLRDACRRGGMSDKDRELLLIYERYQAALHRGALYDREGRFWSARNLLQEENSPSPDQYRLVVVDGFADFTRTQHELIEELARRCREVWISLPLESTTARGDLFAKSQGTQEQLRTRHKSRRVELEWVERPAAPTLPAALAHVERWLFTDLTAAPELPSSDGLELLVAGQAHQEIAAVGRRVKQLLVEGDPAAKLPPARPEEIVVVFRNIEEVAPVVRETFTRLGIPLAVEAGHRLGQSAGLRLLASLVRLCLEDWPYRQLLSVVGNGYFRPAPLDSADEDRTRRAVEWLIRQAGLPRGRDALVQRVSRLMHRGLAAGSPQTAVEESSRNSADLGHAARLALPVLESLRSLLDRLPRQASLATWRKTFHGLARDCGILERLSTSVTAGEHELTDRSAWLRFNEVWEELETHESLWASGPLDRRELLNLLEETLGRQQVMTSPAETGRVRVLSANSARALRPPYLFLAGLTETSFPQPQRDDQLYAEADARRLAEAGLPMVTRAERSQEELLLFYEVLTRATRRLCLSYPSIDRKGQTLLPSPLLTEVQRLCGHRLRITRVNDLSPVPDPSEVWSPGDWQLAALSSALNGDSDPLTEAWSDRAAAAVRHNVAAGLRAMHQRTHGEGLGVFEGILAGDAARDAMARRYGPAHVWSASQLEQYAACPFKFYLQQVIRVEPPPDLELAIDHGRRGRLIHSTLATIHRRLNQEHGRPMSPCNLSDAEVQRLFADQLAVEVGALGEESRLTAALVEVDRRWVLRHTEDYHRQHAKYDEKVDSFDEPPRPTLFEVSFGLAELGEDVRSTFQALEIGVGDQRVLVAGRIDRVDVGRWRQQVVFNVLDYKSSARVPAHKDIENGVALQLPLYAWAVESLILAGEAARPFVAGYWQLRQAGFKPAPALGAFVGDDFGPTESWQAIKQTVSERVLALARGARNAEFPVYSNDDQCTSLCEFHTVCRVHQVRSLEKSWQPPRAS